MSRRSPSDRGRVQGILRTVRSRWRARLLLRGVAIVLGAGLAAFLLSAYALEATRFAPAAVLTFRALVWAVVLFLFFFFLLRPLLRRVTDEQVALYLEEHEPSLEAAILGAAEAERRARSGSGALPEPLLEKLVERAVRKARAVEDGRRVDRKGLTRSGLAFGLVSLVILGFLFLAPGRLRYGVTALVVPTTDPAAVSPYAILVQPGDTTVARGSDQRIQAKLQGFTSEDVFVYRRSPGEESYRRVAMLPEEDGSFTLLLLNLLEDTEYYVEADGVRSPTHTFAVVELPYVAGMTHVYHFPDYTGLPPREIEEAGDIAALEGTRVEMTVRTTLPVTRGEVVVDGTVRSDLTSQPDGSLRGEVQVTQDGTYRIELALPSGTLVPASPDYTIDLLPDLRPTVAIREPGRDLSASAIEEVFVQVEAEDDYGVREVRLVYSVNGEAEDTAVLFRGGRDPLASTSVGHTLFLEEWELETGDLISYYAVATDNRAGTPAEARSDIYFITVRPFRRDFRQAQENPGQSGQSGGQQGGAGGQAGNNSLSDLQREVVAATYNLRRDREEYTPEEFSENAVSVALAQARVREEVATLLAQMHTRGVASSDSHFQEIAELLPRAIADMEAAEGHLKAEEVDAALPPEQRALVVLQKAEETYERFVGQQRGQGQAAGGSGGGAAADELADLFELELDKLQNQYETVQRGERRQADESVDELLEKLKELARRQQQEVERQRRRADAQQGAAGGASGGEGQRSLAEETEDAARRLEELSRQTGDARLAETARRLRQAAETMRRSASGSGQTRGAADAASALDELQEAQRRLERAREERTGEGLQDAIERVNRLERSEQAVREGVEELPDDPVGRSEGVRRLQERKDEMLGETEALERDLVRMQQAMQGESPEAAGALGEAVEFIRDAKLKEKLAYTKGVVEQRGRDEAMEWEDQIAEDLDSLRTRLEGAQAVFESGRPDRSLEEALEATRELLRGTESLQRRLEPGSSPDSVAGTEGGRRGVGEAGDSAGVAQRGGRAGRGQAGDSGRVAQAGEGRPGQATDSAGVAQPGGGGRGQAGDSAGVEARRGGQAGGATRGDPRPPSEEEIRQLSREFDRRLGQARDLRRRLAEAGWDTEDLDRAIAALGELRNEAPFGDLPQIERLQEEIRESLRRLEFALRREVEGEGAGRAALTGNEEVPPGFRKMVEEYFKNLARRGGGR